MLSPLLDAHPEYGKYAAWIVILLMLAFGATGIRSAVASMLLKLYEMFIQKNALP